MIAGLRGWCESPLRRDDVIARTEHEGWAVEARRAPLGVVGFVFEGRPNVFADATGVLRTGNTVVMRIGSDALGTAEAILDHALDPALAGAGLPAGTVSLVRSPSRASGWSLFADQRLSLAVARGSGAAVAQLGAVARQAGTPVSLHGTGGAWLVAAPDADRERFRAAVVNSLDRKVCNTLNVCCVPVNRPDLVAVFLEALDEAAGRRGTAARLHVEESSPRRCRRCASTPRSRSAVPTASTSSAASILPAGELGREWEWEDSPEVSLVVTDGVAEAIALCQPLQPASRRLADQRRCGRARALLHRGRRPVRRRRLHPLGGRAVRPRHPGARPVQLAGWPPAGPGRRPLRGLGAHRSPPGDHLRPRSASLMGRTAPSVRIAAAAVAVIVVAAACSTSGVRTETARETPTETDPPPATAPPEAESPDTEPPATDPPGTEPPASSLPAGKASDSAGDSLFPNLGSTDLDVQSYDVQLEYDPESRRLNGTVTISTAVTPPWTSSSSTPTR